MQNRVRDNEATCGEEISRGSNTHKSST